VHLIVTKFEDFNKDNPSRGTVNLWFLGGSSFGIRFHDKQVIFVDLDAGRFDPHLPATDTAPALDLKRSVFLPFDISEIETPTVYLSTHEHRDHCDEISATWIGRQNGTFIGPPSSCEKAKSWGIPPEKIVMLDGNQFQQTMQEEVKICAAPNKDPNSITSNSYVISYNGINVFHNGDSYYDSQAYVEIAKRFPIDVAIINLGRNPAPRNWYHSPREVAKAALDLKPVILIPHHFDKWDVSLEDPAKVQKVAEQSFPEVLAKTKFTVLRQSEVLQYASRKP
jgi:L-ascorbate metabolism protein UlaG (beta-lactamase superfamily)